MREFAIDFPLGLEFLWKAFVTFTARVPAWDGGEGGGGRGRGEGGGFASVMSAEGDYPMLINAHAPSLRPLFEP